MSIPSDNDRSFLDPETFSNVPGGTDDNRRSEQEHRRWQNIRLTQELGEPPELFSFLLLLFSNATDENGEKVIDNNVVEQISSALGIDLQALQQNISSVGTGTITPRDAAATTYANIVPDNVDWSRAPDVNMTDIIRPSNSPTLLNPDLVKRMESNPAIRQRVQWTFEAAQREGLDGNLLANQYWAESKFDPNAESGVGARGIAQFMPFHKGKWGLDTDASFLDAKTSIDAGARFMAHLTNKLGSQNLALVAYNGGEKAINYVDRNVSGDGVNIGQWMAFMQEERNEKGVGARNLWRNQTFGYVAKIDSAYWDADRVALAQQRQSTLGVQFAQGGVEDNDPAQPNPLVASFDGQGRNEITVADGTPLPGENIEPGTTVKPA